MGRRRNENKAACSLGAHVRQERLLAMPFQAINSLTEVIHLHFLNLFTAAVCMHYARGHRADIDTL